MTTVIPPIKSQGIKTKLVGWIGSCGATMEAHRWIEPFMGTGAVAFNMQPAKALLGDSNPHLIRFYQAVQRGEITAGKVRQFLTAEGDKLLKTNGEYYYRVRDRFNSSGNPLDFLFLSRSCFNGMMRFNRKGGFNVPFCRKPNRFAQALVTKISNQVANVAHVISAGNYEFRHQEFRATLSEVEKDDVIYCDPPYIGRHVDYFNTWSERDENELHDLLVKSQCPFIMSTWLKNRYRKNDFIFSLWQDCSVLIKEHYYHVGAKETNRNAVYEALLVNFHPKDAVAVSDLNVDLLRGDQEYLPSRGMSQLP